MDETNRQVPDRARVQAQHKGEDRIVAAPEH